MQAAQCVASMVRAAQSVEDARIRVDYARGRGDYAVVAYSFRDQSGHSQHNIFEFDNDPGKDGLYGYNKNLVRESDPTFGNRAIMEFEMRCHAVGYDLVTGD